MMSSANGDMVYKACSSSYGQQVTPDAALKFFYLLQQNFLTGHELLFIFFERMYCGCSSEEGERLAPLVCLYFRKNVGYCAYFLRAELSVLV